MTPHFLKSNFQVVHGCETLVRHAIAAGPWHVGVAGNIPEVTRMISLPPLTRVSSCSTRAPRRPRANLLSCPLVTQAVPICIACMHL